MADLTIDPRLANYATDAAPYQAVRNEARRLALTAGLEALAAATHAVELLKALPAFDINPCINHDSRIAAERLSADVQRIAASLRTGKVR